MACEKITTLKNFLDQHNFDLIHQNVRGADYFMSPIPDYEKVNAISNSLPDTEQMIIKFFLLGCRVKLPNFRNAFPGVTELLESIGVVRIDGEDFISLNGLILTSYRHLYFFISTPQNFPHCTNYALDVYAGPDTYYLANNLLDFRCNSVLDLCTGSGIQLILACKQSFAKKGVGVDCNPRACHIARINVEINDLDTVIDIRCGDLFDALGHEMFDAIYANPPFIPVPTNINYPICGDGGNDGLNLVSKILSGLSSHLNKDGQAVLFGETLGNKSDWLISQAVKRYSKELYAHLYLLGRIDCLTQALRVGSIATKSNVSLSADTLTSEWLKMYQTQNATRYGSFLLFIKRVPNPSFKITELYSEMTFAERWIPFTTSNYELALSTDVYTIKSAEDKKVNIDRIGQEFLEMCKKNTNLSIYDICLVICNNNNIKDTQSVVDYISALSRTLSKSSLIYFKEK